MLAKSVRAMKFKLLFNVNLNVFCQADDKCALRTAFSLQHWSTLLSYQGLDFQVKMSQLDFWATTMINLTLTKAFFHVKFYFKWTTYDVQAISDFLDQRIVFLPSKLQHCFKLVVPILQNKQWRWKNELNQLWCHRFAFLKRHHENIV